MAEGGVATCPQVFVVDRQASCMSQPSRKASRWPRVSQKFLLLLVGLTLLGLVVEACFIYGLYKKTEEFHLCKHPLCQNLSHPQTSGQQGGAIMKQVGPKESNEIPTVPPHLDQVQQKPFAQLIGANDPKGENNMVLWVYEDASSHGMGYDGKGRLLVEKEGYYYLYSKLTINAAEDCSVIQHKVMKKTSAYDLPITLLRSKRNRCQTMSRSKASGGEDLWNSFLAGIFHLQSDDEIFVILENNTKIRPGSTDNFMGAFMIFPGKILPTS